MAATLHRRPDGNADDVRFVEDGTRFAVFLFAPLALLARRLWGALLAWAVLVGIAVGAGAAGFLAGWAVFLAILAIHLAFAIDIAHLERARLARRGFVPIALGGGRGDVPAAVVADDAPPLAQTAVTRGGSRVPPPTGDVIGLFPGERP